MDIIFNEERKINEWIEQLMEMDILVREQKSKFYLNMISMIEKIIEEIKFSENQKMINESISKNENSLLIDLISIVAVYMKNSDEIFLPLFKVKTNYFISIVFIRCWKESLIANRDLKNLIESDCDRNLFSYDSVKNASKNFVDAILSALKLNSRPDENLNKRTENSDHENDDDGDREDDDNGDDNDDELEELDDEEEEVEEEPIHENGNHDQEQEVVQEEMNEDDEVLVHEPVHEEVHQPVQEVEQPMQGLEVVNHHENTVQLTGQNIERPENQIEVIEVETRSSALEKNSSNLIITMSKDLPKNRGNEHNMSSKELEAAKNYAVFIAQGFHRDYFPCQVRCPGCEKWFPAYRVGQFSKEFYEHCVKGCEKYRKLGFIAHCKFCRLSFFNGFSFKIHFTRFHYKIFKSKNHRKYKTIKTYRSKRVLTVEEIEETKNFAIGYPNSLQSNDGTCFGCKQKFKRFYCVQKETDYYFHCIKECEKYRKLNLIAHCFQCKLSFINKRGLEAHCKKSSVTH